MNSSCDEMDGLAVMSMCLLVITWHQKIAILDFFTILSLIIPIIIDI